MTVQLLPNVEALVSKFLQGAPEMIALIDDRTYTALPAAAVYPLCRVNLFGDVKITQRPLWVARAMVQIEGFGGSKAQAFSIAATAQSCIAERLEGTHAEGTVCGVEWGPMRDLPDTTFPTAKPRFITTAYVTVHP